MDNIVSLIFFGILCAGCFRFFVKATHAHQVDRWVSVVVATAVLLFLELWSGSLQSWTWLSVPLLREDHLSIVGRIGEFTVRGRMLCVCLCWAVVVADYKASVSRAWIQAAILGMFWSHDLFSAVVLEAGVLGLVILAKPVAMSVSGLSRWGLAELVMIFLVCILGAVPGATGEVVLTPQYLGEVIRGTRSEMVGLFASVVFVSAVLLRLSLFAREAETQRGAFVAHLINVGCLGFLADRFLTVLNVQGNKFSYLWWALVTVMVAQLCLRILIHAKRFHETFLPGMAWMLLAFMGLMGPSDQGRAGAVVIIAGVLLGEIAADGLRQEGATASRFWTSVISWGRAGMPGSIVFFGSLLCVESWAQSTRAATLCWWIFQTSLWIAFLNTLRTTKCLEKKSLEGRKSRWVHEIAVSVAALAMLVGFVPSLWFDWVFKR